MHGLLRVRHITQDDAHIFCRWDQVEDEVVGCLELASVIYDDVRARGARRALDPPGEAPRQRGGVGPHGGRARLGAHDGRLGLRREPRRRRVLRAQDRPPHDRLDRAQLADGHDPARRLDAAAPGCDLHDERGRARAPVHDPPRAVRLVRALHRHPDRALRRCVPALARAGAGGRAAAQRASCATTPTRSSPPCARSGLRAELDAREEKVGRKIHDAEVQKVPVMLVLGGREAEARTVSVRRHGGVDVGVKPLDEVVARAGRRGARAPLAPTAAPQATLARAERASATSGAAAGSRAPRRAPCARTAARAAS